MAGSERETIAALIVPEDEYGIAKKLANPRVPDNIEVNLPALSKRKSLRLAAALVLLSVLVLTAAKFRVLLNPAHLDSMASAATERFSPGSTRYWHTYRVGDELDPASPIHTLASTQVIRRTGFGDSSVQTTSETNILHLVNRLQPCLAASPSYSTSHGRLQTFQTGSRPGLNPGSAIILIGVTCSGQTKTMQNWQG